MVRSLVGKEDGSTPQNTMVELQAKVMRNADQYAAAVEQAADDFAAQASTADARAYALQWKLQQATAAYINATGENPALNTVDMVVLAAVSRMVVQDVWVGQRFGESANPLLAAHRQIETNAWALAQAVLTPAQQQEVRSLVEEWRRQNPNQRYVAAARLSELVGRLGKTPERGQDATSASVFSLAFIDPLSGLDPAVRSLEQTRFLVQRTMYYVQRAPKLLAWQAELLTYHLAEQPAAQQVLADAERFTRSTDSFAETAGQLPQLVREEREAAIRQLLAGVATERSNILASLEAQEVKLRELLPEMRQTLAAGGDMAGSVNAAVKSLDEFVRYVSPRATNGATRPADTNRPPFNVLDYGTAASQVGAMARDLNALLASLNQTTPELANLGRQSSAEARRVVDHAFRLGLLLIGILLTGSLMAALAYRFLADRLRSRRPLPPPPNP